MIYYNVGVQGYLSAPPRRQLTGPEARRCGADAHSCADAQHHALTALRQAEGRPWHRRSAPHSCLRGRLAAQMHTAFIALC